MYFKKQGFIETIKTVYNIQKMQFVQCTPSVNFQIEDYTITTHKNKENNHEDQTLFQLSNTNDKNLVSPQNLPNISQLDINKQQVLETTPTVLRIDTQDFFQEFSSKFTVKFEQSQSKSMKKKLNELRRDTENEQVQQMSLQNSIQDFKDVRLSFPIETHKQNYFGISINNQKGLKSQIISFKKKGCFGKDKNTKKYQTREISEFQINSAVVKLKKKPDYHLPQAYQPKSCRNINGNLYFTSKATPIDAKIAKKAVLKYCGQGNMKKRQKSVNLPQIVNVRIKSSNNIGIEKPKRTCFTKKENMFNKLPSLK